MLVATPYTMRRRVAKVAAIAVAASILVLFTLLAVVWSESSSSDVSSILVTTEKPTGVLTVSCIIHVWFGFFIYLRILQFGTESMC